MIYAEKIALEELTKQLDGLVSKPRTLRVHLEDANGQLVSVQAGTKINQELLTETSWFKDLRDLAGKLSNIASAGFTTTHEINEMRAK